MKFQKKLLGGVGILFGIFASETGNKLNEKICYGGYYIEYPRYESPQVRNIWNVSWKANMRK